MAMKLIVPVMQLKTSPNFWEDLAASGPGREPQWPKAKCENGNDHKAPFSYCMRCDLMYCHACWAKQTGHAKKPHELTPPTDAITTHTTLSVRIDGYSLLKKAIEDYYAKKKTYRGGGVNSEWFGVTAKNMLNDYDLHEGPAYEEIMGEAPVSSSASYPSLVSFVGETGCGKSTLISLLIKFSQAFSFGGVSSTPVVGESGSQNSTSSNVHLYADPDTFLGGSPLLYADCEGMDGDEIPSQLNKTGDPDAEAVYNVVPFNTQKIDWQDDDLEKGKSLSRKRITKTLFPKILYIFSDVVIYIIHNRRRLEDTLLHLISWAHEATEQAYNKPVLPCAIIVFMNKDGEADPKEYNINVAKEKVFGKLKDIHGHPDLKTYIEYWESNNHKIETGQSLLRCYYSSISVVHFPNGEFPTKMHEQTSKLYHEINRFCFESQKRRETAQMRLSASVLPLYIRRAFTHFATHSKTPFDFSDAWIKLHQISFNLESSILNLAIKYGKQKQIKGIKVWHDIAPFVSSCLLLNWLRKNPSGTRIPKLIWEECDRATDQYWRRYWPCGYGDDDLVSCDNSPSGHMHHQGYSKKSRRIINRDESPSKTYWSHNIEELQKEFRGLVEKTLEILEKEVHVCSSHRARSLTRVSDLHFRNANTFYQNLDIDNFFSHSTCLVCLDGIPEHCLPCGHVVCGACVLAAGEPIDGGFVKLKQCPLLNHRDKEWSEPWTGCVKPSQAGLRIMTLDGGGIKGIVELGILKRIQEQLDPVALPEFFDLIVGTSAGGIIACGLGPGELTVQECATMFETLSTKSFSRPRMSVLPLAGGILSIFNHGSYMTKPLEDALKEVFPENRKLFGGVSGSTTAPVKIAVTTSTAHGGVIVLSNYNRKPPNHAFYDFQRPPPERELCLWEAARATSAAPLYFAPLAHNGTGQVYLDGGLWHNNPVRIADAEARAIWPDSKSWNPDILLSIGTGHQPDSTLINGAQRYQEQVEIEMASVDGAGTRSKTGSYARLLLRLVTSQVMGNLNCERIWHEWLEARVPGDEQARRRYRRLTVEFAQAVKMDDASEEAIKACHDAVRGMDASQFRETADQLIASCFYFHFGVEDIAPHGGRCKISGFIKCRLRPESIALLGQYLENLCKGTTFQPYFVVCEEHKEKRRGRQKRIQIGPEIIRKMKENKNFGIKRTIKISNVLAKTKIFLVLRGSHPQDSLHISGFPRRLLEDYGVASRFIRSAGLKYYNMARVKGWLDVPRKSTARTVS